MIKFNIISDKSMVKNGKQDKSVLFQLIGEKGANQKKQRFNLSLVIDISTSMGSQIYKATRTSLDVYNGNNNPNPMLINYVGGGLNLAGINNAIKIGGLNFNKEMVLNKMELVKSAAIESINALTEEDLVSVVTFSDIARMIAPSQKATKENKAILIAKINQLYPNGNTNLHDGWVMGATEIAKHQSNDMINRVMVLTDGEVNGGVTDKATIVKNVADLNARGISTSTFGVGDSFNEDLLTEMAESGGGNFYYIQSSEELAETFKTEFSGLSNLCGQNASIRFEFTDVVKGELSLNNLQKLNDKYLVPNIFHGKVVNTLFKLALDVKKKTCNLGFVVFEYKDLSGNIVTVKNELNYIVAKKDIFEKEQINSEVNVQETLIVIANNKLTAKTMASRGDIVGAQGVLRASTKYMESCNLNDERLDLEKTNLGQTILSSMSMSAKEFSKDLNYQSYKTRTSKD